MRTLFIFLAGCCTTVLMAQQQPQFIMPIWFEDSRGNKDTVWVGGDPSASSQNINPQFGEIAITAPFDSVFEVRAVHTDDGNWKTSKTIVELNDSPGQCYLPASTRLMFHVKYPPVKISWDTTILATNYPCNINTILTPDQFVSLLENWYEARIIHCMMTRQSIEISNLFPIPPPDQLEHPFEVEGEGIKVLPGLWFVGFWDFPHCYTTLSSSEVDLQQQVVVSPNPVKDYLRISNQSGLDVTSVRVVRLDGQTVYLWVDNNRNDWIETPTNGLASGFYFVQVVLENGVMITRKIIKE
ncbi:MAG: T9SS type A sorting domain-containing protein [Saprospiraceae bacterium]|nr:T9SS type A sorting domain-containing protein [Saprospiraceae bacterium]MDW8483459.1 T9SS type A sorting domain-containing protein [Saprospiraceae bacterium]